MRTHKKEHSATNHDPGILLVSHSLRAHHNFNEHLFTPEDLPFLI